MTPPRPLLVLVVAIGFGGLVAPAESRAGEVAGAQEPAAKPAPAPSELPLPPVGAFEEEERRRAREELDHALADAEQHVDEWGPKSPLGRYLMLGMILFGALLALVLGVFFRRRKR